MSNTGTDLERCSKCGKIITTIGEYCPNCGAKLFDDMSLKAETTDVEEKNDGLAICPDCGKPVSKLAFSCPNCGRPLRDSPSPKQEIKIENKKENNGCGTIIGVVIGTLLLLWGLSDMLKLFR